MVAHTARAAAIMAVPALELVLYNVFIVAA
jgi:hypothetical protein